MVDIPSLEKMFVGKLVMQRTVKANAPCIFYQVLDVVTHNDNILVHVKEGPSMKQHIKPEMLDGFDVIMDFSDSSEQIKRLYEHNPELFNDIPEELASKEGYWKFNRDSWQFEFRDLKNLQNY